jgi:hypothetical protein
MQIVLLLPLFTPTRNEKLIVLTKSNGHKKKWISGDCNLWVQENNFHILLL